MPSNIQDRELVDGRANSKPSESPRVDVWGRALTRQYERYPDWGRDMENKLQAKRGSRIRRPVR